MLKMYSFGALTMALSVSAGMVAAQDRQPGIELIAQWDFDGDGMVTLDEARAKRGEVFYMFDIAGDGVLDAQDWAGIDEHMRAEGAGKGPGHGAKDNPAAPGAVIRAAMTTAFNDTDLDGAVTLPEFEAATDRMFWALDANSDHVVSAADFSR